jgi:nucleoside-diphosphate-sugar epimerase
MRRVLLTGASHLVGSHVLGQLLAHNLCVRAVVASREEAEALQQSFPGAGPSRLDFAIVRTRDIGVPGAYDDALNGNAHPFDTVIHALAADPNDEADCLSRFITLETDTLINFLQSVRKIGTSVERVIMITSLSPFARWLVDPFVLRSPIATSSPFSFSPRGPPEVDAEYVLATCQASDNIVYNDIRNWITSSQARFDLVAVTAPSIYGPSMRPLENSSDLQEANRRIWNICSNDSREHLDSPPYGIDFYSDVRVIIFLPLASL